MITFLIQKLAECLAHSGYSINDFNCPKFPLYWFSSPKASLKLETVITQSQGSEVIVFSPLKSMMRSSFLEPPAPSPGQYSRCSPGSWSLIPMSSGFYLLLSLALTTDPTYSSEVLPAFPSLPLFAVFPWSGIPPPPCLGFCLAVVSDSWTLPEPGADVIPASGSSPCSPDQLGVLISAY